MKRKLIYFIAMILLMTIAGMYLGIWFAIIRSLHSFSYEEFIHIGKVIRNNMVLPMQIIILLCIFILLLCLWFYRYKRSTGFYFGLISLFLLILTLILFLVGIKSIGNEINEWSSVSIPSQWEYVRNKWNLFHALSALVSILSFGCFSWFVLAAMKKNKLVNY